MGSAAVMPDVSSDRAGVLREEAPPDADIGGVDGRSRGRSVHPSRRGKMARVRPPVVRVVRVAGPRCRRAGVLTTRTGVAHGYEACLGAGHHGLRLQRQAL